MVRSALYAVLHVVLLFASAVDAIHSFLRSSSQGEKCEPLLSVMRAPSGNMNPRQQCKYCIKGGCSFCPDAKSPKLLECTDIPRGKFLKGWRCNKKHADQIVSPDNGNCNIYLGAPKWVPNPSNSAECKPFDRLYNHATHQYCDKHCNLLCAGFGDCIKLKLRVVSGDSNDQYSGTVKATVQLTHGTSTQNKLVEKISYTTSNTDSTSLTEANGHASHSSNARGTSYSSTSGTFESATLSARLSVGMGFAAASVGASATSGSHSSGSSGGSSQKQTGTFDATRVSSMTGAKETNSQMRQHQEGRSTGSSSQIKTSLERILSPRMQLFTVQAMGTYGGSSFPIGKERVVSCPLKEVGNLESYPSVDYLKMPCMESYLGFRMLRRVDVPNGLHMCRPTSLAKTRLRQKQKEAERLRRQQAMMEAKKQAEEEERRKKQNQIAKKAEQAQRLEQQRAAKREKTLQKEATRTKKEKQLAERKLISSRLSFSTSQVWLQAAGNKGMDFYVGGHTRKATETLQLNSWAGEAIKYKMFRPPGKSGGQEIKSGDEVVFINQHPLHPLETQLYSSAAGVAYHCTREMTRYNKGTWTILRLERGPDSEYIHAGDKIALRNVQYNQYLFADPLEDGGEYGRTWSSKWGKREWSAGNSASDFFIDAGHDPFTREGARLKEAHLIISIARQSFVDAGTLY